MRHLKALNLDPVTISPIMDVMDPFVLLCSPFVFPLPRALLSPQTNNSHSTQSSMKGKCDSVNNGRIPLGYFGNRWIGLLRPFRMMSWWNWTLSLSSFCSPRGHRVTRSVPKEAAPLVALYIVMLENGWKPKAGMIWRKRADPCCSLLCDERWNPPIQEWMKLN